MGSGAGAGRDSGKDFGGDSGTDSWEDSANTAADVKITSTLETESDVRLKETNSAVSVKNGGSDAPRAFELPKQLQYSRLLFVTYLDDDLLVVRDETGVPEVLLRKEKEFQMSEGEPSSADDDLAPGAG